MNQSLSFCTLFLIHGISLCAQSTPQLQNLEGAWYQTGRTSVCYSIWQYSGDQLLENRTYSIVCGDTVELSRAVIEVRSEGVRMTLRTDSVMNGVPQMFRLSPSDNDALIWENEDPAGSPRQLEWIFTGSSYATFRADGLETYYRRRHTSMKLRFRVSAGANLSTFSDSHTPNHYLALQNVGIDEVSYQRLPGQELAVSAGLFFRETPLCLNFELGLARRQVGVYAGFVSEMVSYSRDGVYDYFNTYFALSPEIFIGAKRDLSLSAGFYFDLAQQRGFRGSNFSSSPAATHADPRQDIDVERGWLVGVACRLPMWTRLQPSLYIRHMFGLNNTRVRALSLGASIQIGEK